MTTLWLNSSVCQEYCADGIACPVHVTAGSIYSTCMAWHQCWFLLRPFTITNLLWASACLAELLLYMSNAVNFESATPYHYKHRATLLMLPLPGGLPNCKTNSQLFLSLLNIICFPSCTSFFINIRFVSVNKLGALLTHTPHTHCAICRSTFVCMVIINFCEFKNSGNAVYY